MPARPLLHIENIAVTVAGAPILEGVSLTLHAGERIGITGASGLGKTSLLRVIAGLDPVRGTLRLRGKTPEELGWPAYRRQVMLINQRPVLLDASVRENLARPFRYRLNHGAFPENRARTLIEALGVETERLDQPARSLSEGQQQRVCLVRALLLEPTVLLLDEPTSALDAANAGAVERAVEAYVAEGDRAALLVSHDAAQTERWCTQTAPLEPWQVRGVNGAAYVRPADD